jgi:NAD(P)-dependent dehydrogenase (short-subunit alcohol dehydrogenase family)
MIGGDAAAIQGDTTSLANLDRIFAQIQAQAGRIDVLAVNAAIYEFGTLGEISEEHFDRTFNTNVRGLLFTVQKALPLLRACEPLVRRSWRLGACIAGGCSPTAWLSGRCYWPYR